jgi:hypothetical protein
MGRAAAETAFRQDGWGKVENREKVLRRTTGVILNQIGTKTSFHDSRADPRADPFGAR